MAAEAVRRLSFASGPADGLPAIEGCRSILVDDFFDENKLNFMQDKDMLRFNRSMDSELNRLKEHFAKLKFNYLELVTKKTFLHHLATNTWRECCDKNDLATLDGSVKEAKNAVKEVKDGQETLKTELENMLAELANCYSAMEQKKQAMRIHMNQLQPLIEAAMVNGGQDTQLSQEECQRTLVAQEETIKELNNQTQHLQDSISEMEAYVVPLEDRVNALRDQAIALESTMRIMPQNPEKANLAEMYHWYTDVNGVLSSLSGVEILTIVENKVKFNITTQWSSHDVVAVQHSLVLDFDHGTSNISDIQLEPNDTVCDDIFAYAMENNDIRFLIRELKMRIRNCAQRRGQVKELQARYPTLAFTGAENLTVSFNNTSYTLEFDMDYPQPYASVRVTQGPYKSAVSPKVPTRLPVLLEKLANHTPDKAL